MLGIWTNDVLECAGVTIENEADLLYLLVGVGCWLVEKL